MVDKVAVSLLEALQADGGPRVELISIATNAGIRMQFMYHDSATLNVVIEQINETVRYAAANGF